MVKDDFDWKIINLLQKNSRFSFAQISREIGLSPSAVGERVQRLEDENVITKYISIINYKKAGYSLQAYITLAFKEFQYYQRFLKFIDNFPEIIDCSRITGNDCLIMKVVLVDNSHLENLVNRLAIYGSPSTSVVLSDVISNNSLKFPEFRES
ncbi:Lrp/AsnC family transcriptional regulator [Hyunsoonleella pacifica]|uniref:Lrp/AsnC family transcriptional regulator n=1 Tax=Hyunsoonleella pacifica TaxID=1080224 RepID=A0A4Q9FLR5_9FLAO|nr:Lrp/AsnC family transcriptional regulator [Hyunsoonleella pacifica]TBN13798.1 Lrp/AsnC family transcriptional regulator [Hyunsoonleella pacifica]GGD25742.1 transcriptional regulator [Hyunsoonleella pacifica]